MDPIPELLKHFIITYSTELFTGLMVLAGVGLWTIARRFRRAATPARLAQTFPAEATHPLDADPLMRIRESLDILNDRVALLESFDDFDRQLGKRPDS